MALFPVVERAFVRSVRFVTRHESGNDCRFFFVPFVRSVTRVWHQIIPSNRASVPFVPFVTAYGVWISSCQVLSSNFGFTLSSLSKKLASHFFFEFFNKSKKFGMSSKLTG